MQEWRRDRARDREREFRMITGKEREMGGIFLVLLFLSLPGGDGAAAPSPAPSLHPALAVQSGEFNVQDFGAIADGKTDSSEAFTAAWVAACGRRGETTAVVIPAGTFFVNPLVFSGPCNSSVEVRVQGTVVAPPDLAAFSGDKGDWISFRHVDRLHLGGGGTFDGRGGAAWDCTRNRNCTRKRPTLLSFNFITNSTVEQIKLVDGKMFHIHVFSCTNLTLQHLEISAPANSPNTDGIHIAESSKVRVADSVIGAGDDCVSIGGGTSDISVSGVTCGPGHGISIGSLGGAARDKDVVGVSVTNCNLTGTTNGVRIKTWAKPYSLSASSIVFQGISMDRVSNPILIDQNYCPHRQCTQESASMVKISNVRFQTIKGSSTTKVAIQLSCSKSEPCEDVQLIDIDLTYVDKDQKSVSSCSNVQGRTSGSVIPASCL